VAGPDLVKRDFPAAKINCKWYGDGIEIGTGEGKLYLASVLFGRVDDRADLLVR
jgi:putative transposase